MPLGWLCLPYDFTAFSMISGVLNVHKPAGMTSHDVVGQVRRLAHQKRVGHAGTLDPDATGVLLVCLGAATRLSDYLADEGKDYQATLALGATTTTEDASGEVLAEADASQITLADLQAVLPRFVGTILQTPPMVSAVHHQGQRLYALARQGITVEREARPVRIDSITLRDWTPGARALATLDVSCGKGTYIRTLCADVGDALGVGGHMAALQRTRVGRFALADAVPLDALTSDTLPAHLVSPANALSEWPAHIVHDNAREDILHGRAVPALFDDDFVVKVLDTQGQLLALARAGNGLLSPFKVFPPD